MVNGDEVHVIDAVKGVKVVDTTGAGDAYAAGFLYAYTQGRDLKTCGTARRRDGGAGHQPVRARVRRPRDIKALAAKSAVR